MCPETNARMKTMLTRKTQRLNNRTYSFLKNTMISMHVRLKVPFFVFFLVTTFVQTTITQKKVQALTLILSRNGCSSQCTASQPLSVFIASNSPWPTKPFTTLRGCCPLLRTPFSNFVRMRTRSLVPRPKTTFSLEARQSKWPAAVLARSFPLAGIMNTT